MLLDDMATYLSAQGFGTIYKDFMPASPDSAIVAYIQPGLAPVHTMEPPHVLEQPRVQVTVRNESLQTAHQTAKAVYGALNGLRTQTINGVVYHWITALSEPYVVGRDMNDRFLVACQYDVKKDRST